MAHAHYAIKCFEENLRLFGNARTDPEKYNLYNGLTNLASSLRDIENEIAALKTMVRRIPQE